MLHCRIRFILLLSIECFIVHSSRQWQCHRCKAIACEHYAIGVLNLNPSLEVIPVEKEKKKKCKRMGSGLGWVFQDNWVAKLPWMEIIFGFDGKVHMVRCQVWTWIKGRNKFFVPKFDNVLRNINAKKKTPNCILGQYYMTPYLQHPQNKWLFFRWGKYIMVDMVVLGYLDGKKKISNL